MSTSPKRPRWAHHLSLGPTNTPQPDLPDRLTALPDTLRLHILSLLPLKSAIMTSSLNTKWYNLWPHRFPSPHPSVLSLSPSPSNFNSIDSYLVSNPLDSLLLSLPPSPRLDQHLLRWLQLPSSQSLSLLQIQFTHPPTTVPQSSNRRRRNARRHADRDVTNLQFSTIALLEKLVVLSLSGINFRGPTSSLRALTASVEILILHNCPVTDSALKKIIGNCPELKSVEIWACGRLRNIVIAAASDRLERVTVGGCGKVGEISVSAVGLRSFRFVGGFVRSFAIDWPEAIEDAFLSSGGLVSVKESNWVSSFGGFTGVKFLTFCSLSLQYIAAAHTKSVMGLMMMNRLRELQLLMAMMTNSNLAEIYRFFSLYGFPRLEKIFVELPTDMLDQHLFTFLEVGEEKPQDVMFPNLKIVKMNNFKFHKNEIKLVKFFLEKASLLEAVVLVVPQEMDDENGGSFEENYDMLLSQLTVLTKASADCQIILSDKDDKKLRHKHSDFIYKV